MCRMTGMLPLALAILSACVPTPPETEEGASEEVIAAEQEKIQRTRHDTLVWCAASSPYEPYPASAPKFHVPHCGRDDCDLTFKHVGTKWCDWDIARWNRTDSWMLHPLNQAALKVNSLSIWHAPSGAAIEKVVEDPPQASIQSAQGFFRMTLIKPLGQIILMQNEGDLLTPDSTGNCPEPKPCPTCESVKMQVQEDEPTQPEPDAISGATWLSRQK